MRAYPPAHWVVPDHLLAGGLLLFRAAASEAACGSHSVLRALRGIGEVEDRREHLVSAC